MHIITQKHLADESEYAQATQLLDKLIDEVGEDETHPFAPLMELLGKLIADYENENIPELTPRAA